MVERIKRRLIELDAVAKVIIGGEIDGQERERTAKDN